jgi:hypothetical protein
MVLARSCVKWKNKKIKNCGSKQEKKSIFWVPFCHSKDV